jgi:hypothetical protein
MSQVKSLLRVPYGLRDGKMWAARDVPTGLACGCLCLGCEQPLVAKNHGQKVRPHFAHHVDRACQGAFESSIHRRAKELIVDKKVLMLPEWDGNDAMPNPPFAHDDDGHTHYGKRIEMPAYGVALAGAQAELQMGDYRPDVVAIDSAGRLLIEILVTHAVGDLKTRNVQSDGFRMMEIDLSRVSADQAEDPDLFEDLVLNTAVNRKWISHPSASENWRRSRDELKETIRHQNASIAVDRAHRQKLREETDARLKAREARKSNYRNDCRQPHRIALESLNAKTSSKAVEDKYIRMLEQDQAKADQALKFIMNDLVKPYLRTVPRSGWVYDAHPFLWQAGAYVRFIEGKPSGHGVEQAILGRWIRSTYGADEALWSLFRAQWQARVGAYKRGFRTPFQSAWFFSEEENKRIPNFYEPINEFVDNMMRCSVLMRDPDRRGWLKICDPRLTPLHSLRPHASR